MNNKELGYFFNEEDLEILDPEYGQLILINCTRVLVANQTFADTTNGCFIKYSENITLIDNYCTGIQKYAFHIEESENALIEQNIFQDNYYRCLFMQDCYYSTIFNNSFFNTVIYDTYLYSCHNSIVTDNLCTDSLVGIHFEMTTNSLIANNTCTGNNNGIIIYTSTKMEIVDNIVSGDGYRGIWLEDSNNNTITKNTCFGKTNGFILDTSDYNQIYNNSFHSNGWYGFELNSGTGNEIYFNNFVDNCRWIGDVPQAFDEGINNTWYNESYNIGNYWDDWDGLSNYTIDGLSGSVDPYPIDYFNPYFLTTLDVEYVFGTTNNNITWMPFDWSPKNYSIYKDDEFLFGGPWDGSSITVDVDSLAIGSYIYRCTVFDRFNNYASDTVTVTVATNEPPVLIPTDNITYHLGSVNNILSWDASDADPYVYYIYFQGNQLHTGFWTSDFPISIPIDGLGLGEYNYTIVVQDELGNNASDTVFVIVIPAVPEFNNLGLVYFLPMLLVANYIVIIRIKRKLIK